MNSSASFSTRLPEWLKSGDIKTEFKKIVKMPAMNDRWITNVFCLSDLDRKSN